MMFLKTGLPVVAGLALTLNVLASDDIQEKQGANSKIESDAVVAGVAPLPRPIELEAEIKEKAKEKVELDIASEDPPVRLRDRLVMVEKRFVEHAARMDAHEKEVASMLLRIKTLEQMLYEQGPVIIDKTNSDAESAKKDKQLIKPYRFSN